MSPRKLETLSHWYHHILGILIYKEHDLVYQAICAPSSVGMTNFLRFILERKRERERERKRKREREDVLEWGGADREGKQNLKQAPGS